MKIFSQIQENFLQLITSKFSRQVATLATGTSIAQIITIATSPIITRLFSPESLGVSALFISIIGPLAIISTLSYPTAIVLPRNQSQAVKLILLSIYLAVVFTFVLIILWLMSEQKISEIFDMNAIQSYAYLAPLAILGTSISGIISQWLIRNKSFLLISKIAIITAIITSAIKIIVGYYYPDPIVLIYSAIISYYISLFFIKFIQPDEFIEIKFFNFSKRKFLQLYKTAIKYSDFLIYRTPQTLLNYLNHSISIFMLTLLFGLDSAGYYSLAFAVLSVPITVISGSVYQAIYPKINSVFLDGQSIYPYLIKSILWLSVFGLVPTVTLIFFGKEIFTFIFGDEWEKTGIYVQFMSIALFFYYIGRPIFAAIPVLKLQRDLLFWEVCDLILRSALFYFAYKYNYNDVFVISLLSILSAINIIALMIYVLIKCRNQRLIH